jgi:sugar phosphate isomerase/epimerase
MQMAKIPVALQMYTVREEQAKDFVGTLRKVREIGYEAVEFAGTGGLSAEDLRAVLDDLGLKAMGTHVGLDALTDKLDETIEYNLAIANPFLVCPGIPEQMRNSAEAWRKTAAILDAAGAKAREQGLLVGYHNHDKEFQKHDGQHGLDILLKNSSPGNVSLELDVFWARYAGVDPAAYMKTQPGRIALLHLKDMGQDQKTFMEVGEGIIDFQAIFAQVERAGVQGYIVEQDTCARPCLESVRISLENLKKWGIA